MQLLQPWNNSESCSTSNSANINLWFENNVNNRRLWSCYDCFHFNFEIEVKHKCIIFIYTDNKQFCKYSTLSLLFSPMPKLLESIAEFLCITSVGCSCTMNTIYVHINVYPNALWTCTNVFELPQAMNTAPSLYNIWNIPYHSYIRIGD